MPKCISNNPFRILGVYSNASAKDIAGNKSKLQAYLRIHGEVTFPIDKAVSLPVFRTTEIVNKALSDTNLPQDKIKHALFWFIKGNDIDDMAVRHLASGNSEKFTELLERKDDYASRVNNSVFELSCEDFDSAVRDMTAVIHDNDDRKAFVIAVCGKAYSISEEELAHLYVDTLFEDYPDEDWRQIFLDNGESKDDYYYITDKVVGKPISEINAEIVKAKSVDRDDAEANRKAGKQLIVSTKENLALLKDILGKTDSKYQMIADKLANQILQNGINYFNNVDDADGIDDAMKIQSYAQTIAIGKVAKDRCYENEMILNEIKAKLPPVSCRYHDEIIKKKIISAIRNKSCESAIQLIKDAYIYLQSIKAEVGSTSEYYLRISTEVAQVALELVIDDFNSTFNDSLDVQLLLDRENTMSRVKSKCCAAVKATLYMDKLDMEADFKNNRYAPNKDTLKRQADQIDVYVFPFVATLDYRNEESIFTSAKNLHDLEEYKSLFPKGKYIKECKAKAERFAFDACKTTQDCENFKRQYPNSTLNMDAKCEDCLINQCKTLPDFQKYLSSYPNGRYRKLVQDKISRIEFDSCRSIQEYQAFISKHPRETLSNEAGQIIADEQAWAKACASDQKSDYKEYLSVFPNGRHKDAAQIKARACYVATMVYGDYNCPEVVALRSFRDNVLRDTRIGEAFIAFYYKRSPAWVEKMQGKKAINSMIKTILNMFVKLYIR